MPRASGSKDDVVTRDEVSEYVDAPSEPDEDLRVYSEEDPESDPPTKPNPRRQSTKSFTTATSHNTEPDDTQEQEEASSSQVPTRQGQRALGKRPVSTAESSNGLPSEHIVEVPSVDAVSTTHLLPDTDVTKVRPAVDQKSSSKGMFASIKRKSQRSSEPESSPIGEPVEPVTRKQSNLRNLVKFDIPEDSKRAELHLRAKTAQMTMQRASTRLRRQKLKDGIVVKMERMLVRVDEAAKDVPDDFDENASQKIDSRVKDKWREYMIVCRQSISDDADFVLQMYKTRVCGLPGRLAHC